LTELHESRLDSFRQVSKCT